MANKKQQPNRYEMPPRRFDPSAVFITWGLVLLVVGQFIYQAGVQANLQAALSGPSLFSSSPGDGPQTIGGVAELIGLIVLLMGVYRLAVNVDLVAEHIAAARDRKRAASAETVDDEASTPLAEG